MTNKDLSRFYNRLTTLLESGLSIERGLATMKLGKKGPTQWMIDGIHHHIGRGGILWERIALSVEPFIYNYLLTIDN